MNSFSKSKGREKNRLNVIKLNHYLSILIKDLIINFQQCSQIHDLFLLESFQMLTNVPPILVRMEPSVPTLTEATGVLVTADLLERTVIEVRKIIRHKFL